MQVKMTKKAQKAAKRLALDYHHYVAALMDRDRARVAIWGGLLAEIQRDCGVQMVEPDLLESVVTAAYQGTLFSENGE
jgi:hypothetical protein